jgi:preprotein translocase subunit YajC
MEILNSLILIAQAAPEGPAPSPFMTFLPLIFIFVIFYFLLIRPQQKKAKEHTKLISSLKTGDKVITTAGIHGLITNVKEATVTVKVADNVKIEFDKAAVVNVQKSADSSDS